MDLATTYLGLPLKHPFMPGASPLVDDLDTVRRLEDAGASAIVMHSLFEEQIEGERRGRSRYVEALEGQHAEATSYFPPATDYALSPDAYLEQIGAIRGAVDVPVIASLNGITTGGWIEYAKKIQEAGADALELNMYSVATDPAETSGVIERRLVEILEAVEDSVSIPIAVKLSPFYSSLAHLALRLEESGASGLILFNRFYQPDLDLEELAVVPRLHLSDSSELLLRLHWIAILSGRRRLSLAASGGVHSPADAVKAVLCGAHAVQLVSSLLQRGPEHLGRVVAGVKEWLEENEYESLRQAQGSMNLEKCPDPYAYQRGNYVKVLQSWRT